MCRPGPSSLRRSGIVISRIQTRARKLFSFFLEIALARAVRLCDNRVNEMTFARGSAHGSAVFFSNGKEANDGKGPARGVLPARVQKLNCRCRVERGMGSRWRVWGGRPGRTLCYGWLALKRSVRYSGRCGGRFDTPDDVTDVPSSPGRSI